jgi:cell division protein FtsN
MLRLVFVFSALILSATAAAQGQTTARAADAAFARAQEMASDGNSAGGRALIDSIVRATPPASPIYPQALYWRATLATNAADAESDYRHIVVDYPLAPQAEDALLRLAQLELARGDRDDALVHLQRIPRDYPRSKSIARASYWIARVLFEKNDIAGACAANATALAQTAEGEVELRNQIQYQSQRCAAFAASQRAAASSSSAGTASSTPATITASSTPTVAEKLPVSSDTSTRETVTTAPVASGPRVAPPATARDTKPSQVEPDPTLPSAAEARRSAPAPAPPASSVSSRAWSVQVAAYNRKPDAENLVATLEKRGYDARVDGTVAPFRVRIGRYPSAREAEVALAEIKSKKMAGFVVRAP